MKRARLIYNPSSGREEAKKNLPKILSVLEKAGYEASAFATEKAEDATNEARRAVERRFDLVVAAGGDGTVYEVINGLAEQSYRPKLGILPLGTSNDFARAIGIPRDMDEALVILSKGETDFIDIGKMDEKYFINIAGGGVLTGLTYGVSSKLKTVTGQLAYYIKGIEELPRFRPIAAKIEIDGKIMKEKIMLFLIANSNVVGGFEQLAPKAKMNDGKLDVIILKKCNLAEMARVMTLLLKGEHVYDPKIMYMQAENIKISSRNDIMINLDGELGGKSPCEFSVLGRHLETIVNK